MLHTIFASVFLENLSILLTYPYTKHTKFLSDHQWSPTFVSFVMGQLKSMSLIYAIKVILYFQVVPKVLYTFLTEHCVVLQEANG